MAGGSATASGGFRPDLEGLRAVAVLLVLLYHAGVPGVGGGYIGVDVFFVLSGFLITGLLVRELSRTGRIDFPAFYARRARRLLPASALTLAVTAVVSAVVLPPLRMPDVTGDIAAAAGYVSNLRFAVLATDYLGSELAPSPVLHFWSLGVEEQFYLFWPAMLGVLTGAAFAAGDVAGGIRRVAVVLGAVFALSLAFAVWLTGVNQPWAFFSLPARAWELALGGLLAIPGAARLVPARAAPLLGWAGVALVVVAGVAFSASTPFPGTAALLPTVGTAAVIAAGLPGLLAAGAGAGAVPGPGVVLSLAPMRFIGRISYSLYLWHWPVLVLPAVAFGHLPGVVRLALAGLSVVIAAASQRWVEDPLRHGRVVGTRPARNLAAALVATVVVVSGSLGIGALSARALTPTGPAAGGGVDEVPLPTGTPRASTATSSPAPPSGAPPSGAPPSAGASPTLAPTMPPLVAAPVPADLVPTLAQARDDLPVIYSDGCHLDPPVTAVPECAFGVPGSSTTVVLFGDSHAAQWFPALERIALDRGWRLVSLTKSACSSADVDSWSSIFNRPYTECGTWREGAFRRIAAERPALVVVTNARNGTLVVDGAPVPAEAEPDAVSAGLASTITRIEATGSRVVVLGDTVRMADDPPVCLSGHLDDVSACANPRDAAVATARNALDAGVAAAAGASFIDPTPWMCFTDPCPPVIGRFLVYRDTHHMTATYARALATPLAAALPPLDTP